MRFVSRKTSSKKKKTATRIPLAIYHPKIVIIYSTAESQLHQETFSTKYCSYPTLKTPSMQDNNRPQHFGKSSIPKTIQYIYLIMSHIVKKKVGLYCNSSITHRSISYYTAIWFVK
ncbi:unnamed protein product [Periconia digitata]|uniref:Uncharacterized protein n=1 Tax=Periconia digitata TaxID=1303443 RepID=A0A9W4XFB1_9PLEO|nr:unnamed protein product [Periconia digitata]